MKIHIFEDSILQRECLEKITKYEIQKHKYNMQIGIVEGNPYNFMKKLEKDFQEQCIFLIDIDIKAKLTGFDVGKKIRETEIERDAKSHLIITTYCEQMPLTFQYKLGALDCICKDDINQMQARLAECIKKIDIESNKKDTTVDFLKFSISKKEIKIPVKDIIYISAERLQNYIIIILENGTNSIPKTLKEAEDKLQEYDFIKVNKFTLVNSDKIKEMDLTNKKVILNNGERIRIL